MKKLFILSVLGLGLFLNSRAQSLFTNNGFSFGLKAGANISNVIKTGESDFKSKFKPGFAAGIFVNIPVADVISIAPELVYSQKGYQTAGSILPGDDYDYKVTTNFVELPLLVKFYPGLEGFNIFLGPQVSFLTSTTESFKSGSDEFRRTVAERNKNLKKSLLGGVIGLGYNIDENFGLNARYALDFQRNNANGTTEVPAYKNQVIQLGLTYQF